MPEPAASDRAAGERAAGSRATGSQAAVNRAAGGEAAGSQAAGSRDARDRLARYPLGASVTAAELARDAHPVLRRLREAEPVSWLPALGGWLVTRADLADRVLREPGTFTVDDPRFTTARVVGPSMLSLDGTEHRRHRDPFARAMRAPELRTRLDQAAARQARLLVAELASGGQEAELRRGLAGHLAVAVMADMLGLNVAPARLLAWYDAIVAGVSALSVAGAQAAGPAAGDQVGGAPTAGAPAAGSPIVGPPAAGAPTVGPPATGSQIVGSPAAGGPVADEPAPGGPYSGQSPPGGRAGPDSATRTVTAAEAAFAELSACVSETLARPAEPSVLTAVAGDLPAGEVVSNAAVLLFGGIETTEGMICNAVWYLLRSQESLREVLADRALIGGVVEESLRLEPAAAVVDRYATSDVTVGDAAISRGDLVTVSLAAASRDPAVFADPDRFDLHRPNARQHWAFAVGPHFCVGAQLARAETVAAVSELLGQLPGLRLDPGRPSFPQGLVFRKPAALHVRWDG